MIEGYFYFKNPKLKKVPLDKFERAEIIAPLLNLSVRALLNRAAESKSIHGVLYKDEFLIHPSVFTVIGKCVQKQIKKTAPLLNLLETR